MDSIRIQGPGRDTDWVEELERELERTPSREAKLALLRRHFSEGEAQEMLGSAMGEHEPDIRVSGPSPAP